MKQLRRLKLKTPARQRIIKYTSHYGNRRNSFPSSIIYLLYIRSAKYDKENTDICSRIIGTMILKNTISSAAVHIIRSKALIKNFARMRKLSNTTPKRSMKRKPCVTNTTAVFHLPYERHLNFPHQVTKTSMQRQNKKENRFQLKTFTLQVHLFLIRAARTWNNSFDWPLLKTMLLL